VNPEVGNSMGLEVRWGKMVLSKLGSGNEKGEVEVSKTWK
jgi:hypothetical protein